jgi:hypothetical protein
MHLWDNISDLYCCNRYHNDVIKGFWALCDHIYDHVFTTSDFPVSLHG